MADEQQADDNANQARQAAVEADRQAAAAHTAKADQEESNE
jgi:hypothetical protein